MAAGEGVILQCMRFSALTPPFAGIFAQWVQSVFLYGQPLWNQPRIVAQSVEKSREKPLMGLAGAGAGGGR